MLALLAALSTLLGQPSPDWPPKPPGQWVQGGPLEPADLRGKVVLIRFFTGTECPHCSASAPALNELHLAFSPRGLVVIGMYTPKPRPRPVARAEVQEAVEAYGFAFPIAVDADWSALRALWLDRVPGAAYTSASLLLDQDGVVRWVHEGGTYTEQDVEVLREAIVSLLRER